MHSILTLRFNILLGYNNYYVDQASCFLVCVKLLKYNHGVVKMVCGNTQCMKMRSFIHLFNIPHMYTAHGMFIIPLDYIIAFSIILI